MVVGPMFLMEKLGPLSSVFFHFTVMRRSLPLASHGLVNEPTPLDFAGGARQAGEPAGMGAGDECCRYWRHRFRRGPLPVVSAGGGRCLCGGGWGPTGSGSN